MKKLMFVTLGVAALAIGSQPVPVQAHAMIRKSCTL